MDEYKWNGYKDRKDYLKKMAKEFGVEESVVFALASVLGKNEDFDGLITALEDMEYCS